MDYAEKQAAARSRMHRRAAHVVADAKITRDRIRDMTMVIESIDSGKMPEVLLDRIISLYNEQGEANLDGTTTG